MEPSLYLQPLSRYWAISIWGCIWGSRPNWLQANCPDVFAKDQWPPNSPDLNPVEYRVWGAMLEAYRKLKTKLKTIAELREALQVIWGIYNMKFGQNWQLLASLLASIKTSKHIRCSFGKKNCLKVHHIFSKYQLKPNQDFDNENCKNPVNYTFITLHIRLMPIYKEQNKVKIQEQFTHTQEAYMVHIWYICDTCMTIY